MDQVDTALVKFLLEKSLLKSMPDVERLKRSESSLIKALSKAKLISEQQFLTTVSESLNIRIFLEEEIFSVDIVRTMEVASKINFKHCLEKQMLPVVMKDGEMRFLLANPLDVEAISEMQFELEGPYSVAVVSLRVLTKLFCRCDSREANCYGELSSSDFGAHLEILNAPEEEPSLDILNDVKAPVVALVNKVIADAINSNASDIHMDPTQWSYEVRYRIDGTLHSVMEIPKRLQRSVAARMKVLSNMDISEHRKPQDGRMQIRLNSETIDLRVSCIPTSQGESIVLRILQSGKSNLCLEKLDMPVDVGSKIRKAITAEGRMLLVTGPTGSGKTTTLYSCLSEMLKQKPNIVTVEDPIEYRLAGVNQMQVNELAGVTFGSALRSIMRQDPDVILIGEIRDRETAEIAIQAAQTGHLVLSTLHTNDAPSAITRLVDLGVEPFMISSSVSGIVAQRLVRRICPHCKVPLAKSKVNAYKHDEILARYKLPFSRTFEGAGCAQCRDTGYLGRVGIYSYLEISKRINEIIHLSIDMNSVLSAAEEEGFIDLDRQGVFMALNGVTTIEEISPYLVSAGNSKGSSGVEDFKVEKQQVGIFSSNEMVLGRLSNVFTGESRFIPVIINAGVLEGDLAVCIVDESISIELLDNMISSLEARGAMVPIVCIADKLSCALERYKGKVVRVSKGSSPLMIVSQCTQLLGN